jgi:hypothetical protein
LESSLQQFPQSSSRRFLLRFLLAAPFASPNRDAPDSDFAHEDFCVVWTNGLDEVITWGEMVAALNQFLQPALEVQNQPVPLNHLDAAFEVPEDKLIGRLPASVEEYRSDQRFKGISQNGWSVSPAGPFLAFAQQQVLTQPQLL